MSNISLFTNNISKLIFFNFSECLYKFQNFSKFRHIFRKFLKYCIQIGAFFRRKSTSFRILCMGVLKYSKIFKVILPFVYSIIHYINLL